MRFYYLSTRPLRAGIVAFFFLLNPLFFLQHSAKCWVLRKREKLPRCSGMEFPNLGNALEEFSVGCVLMWVKFNKEGLEA